MGNTRGKCVRKISAYAEPAQGELRLTNVNRSVNSAPDRLVLKAVNAVSAVLYSDVYRRLSQKIEY